MGHTFRVYSVDRDGNRHDTEKTIVVKELPTFSRTRQIQSIGSVVLDLFELFGFTQYAAYYRPRISETNPNDLVIWYSYNEGEKPTWYLSRGA